MQKSAKITILLITVLILVLAVLWINSRSSNDDNSSVSTAPTEDPIDSVLSFYNLWLEMEQSTSTNPIEAGLLNNEILTVDARTNLEKALNDRTEGSFDPVLCQQTAPNRIGAKVLFALDTQAQVMVLARGGEEKSPYQAIVTLTAVDGKWRISEISCAQGETAPDREFDFEQKGFLLKSVPPPLDPQYWHLVYERDGILGHTVPLFFSAESTCIASDGTESVCDTNQFTEATEVLIQADMTEAGAEVRRLNFSVGQ